MSSHDSPPFNIDLRYGDRSCRLHHTLASHLLRSGAA